MSSHIKIIIASLAVVCLLTQGCTRDRAELEKRILAQDPSFQKTLDKRNSIRAELNSQKSVFLKRTQQIEDQVNALKGKKDQFKKEYSVQAERIKRQLEPEKRNLQRDLIVTTRQYKRKREEIQDIGRDIDEINALIKKKDALALTQQEIQTWENRLSSLVEKKETMSSEREKLQSEIEIMKMKIKVMDV